MNRFLEYRKKNANKTRVIDEDKSIVVRGNATKGPETFLEYRRRNAGAEPKKGKYEALESMKEDVKTPGLDLYENSKLREMVTESSRRVDKKRESVPKNVETYLKDNPDFHVSTRMPGVESKDGKTYRSYEQIKQEQDHAKQVVNRPKYDFTPANTHTESVIVDKLKNLPKDKQLEREYDPFDKSDRIKLKWQIGQLMDKEGMEWAKVADGADNKIALEYSNKIQDLFDMYPEISEEFEPFHKDPVSRIGAFFQNMFESTSQMLPTMVNAQVEGMKLGLPTSLGFMGMAAVGGQMGPQIAAPEEFLTVPVSGLIGYKVGASTGVTNHMYQVEKGNAYKEMLDNGVPADVANEWSTVVGAVNAGIELAQLGTILKTAKATMGFSKAVTEEGLEKYVTAEGMKLLKKYLSGVAKETGQEVVQEGVTMTGVSGARVSSGQDAKLFTPENASRLLETAIESVKSFAVIQGAGNVVGGMYGHTTKKMAVIEAVNMFKSNPKLMEDEKIRQQMVKLYEEVVNNAEETGDEFLQGAAIKLVQIQTDYAANKPQISSTQGVDGNANTQVVSDEEIVKGDEVAAKKPVKEISEMPPLGVGQTVNTTKYGKVTIESDNGITFTVKNERGTELQIGKKALGDMTIRDETPVETFEDQVDRELLEDDTIEQEIGSFEEPIAPESVETVAPKAPETVEAPKNIGYHAGDLGKAEHFGRQVGSNRSTGHFGTGTYFVGNKERINLGSYKDRPIHEVNFDGYNLYKPKSEWSATALHESLKYLNTYYEESEREVVPQHVIDDLKYGEVDEVIEGLRRLNAFDEEKFKWTFDVSADEFISKQLDIQGVSSYLERQIFDLKEKNNRTISAKKQREYFASKLSSLFDKSQEEILALGDEVWSEIKADKSDLDKTDSPSTRFMKKLGYEGVDVRHIDSMDDTSIGSVIYDLKEDAKPAAKEPTKPKAKHDEGGIENSKVEYTQNDGKLFSGTLKQYYEKKIKEGFEIRYTDVEKGTFIFYKDDTKVSYTTNDPKKILSEEQVKWIEQTYGDRSKLFVVPKKDTVKSKDYGYDYHEGKGVVTFFYKGKIISKDLTQAEAQTIVLFLDTYDGDAKLAYSKMSYASKAEINTLDKIIALQEKEKNDNKEGINTKKDSEEVEQEEVATNLKYKRNTSKIAAKIQELLANNTKITSNDLFKIADDVFGGTQAQGTYTVKDAYDALELGVNQHILKMGDELTVEKMQTLLELLPTQTKRTREMEDFQQFSTPPSIAFVANWVANVDENDVFLEPSAGIGGLAIFAKLKGAKVFVNEYSKRRLDILRNLPFDGFFNENAEQLNNILPKNIKPSVIVMNPPFSATAGRMGDKHATKYAKAHIEQALKRLQPNGRLVAIVGNGMSYEANAFKGWWKELEKQYNIKANYGVDGSNYTKYGTSFDIQIVVIDKTGPTTKDVMTGMVKDIAELPKLLEAIKNERIRNDTRPEQAQGSGSNSNGTQEAESGNRPDGTNNNSGVRSGTETGPHTVQEPPRIVGNDGSNGTDTNQVAGQSIQNPVSTDATNGNPSTGKRGEQSGTDSVDSSTSDDGQLDGKRDNQPSGEGVKIISEQYKNEEEINEDDVYSNYTPQKLKIEGSVEHLTKLVQSAAMAAVEPPNPTYSPMLDKKLITDGELTLPQLEAIVYAGQAHEQILPNGERKGFFIGDGTGVGKGREIAGVILDNFTRGGKKAIWVSNGFNLYSAAIRDWTALYGKKEDVFSHNRLKLDAELKRDGILFTSYSTLASGSNLTGNVKKSMNAGTRLQQIVDWVGVDFDGVIVFDEAHNMSNAIAVKGARGTKKTAEKALAGIELQRLLPNAKIVYASATGATEVSNLAYATRLGLWGMETAFTDVIDFITKISKGGIAAMESVCKDMKAMGVYIARTISFDGVDYDTLEHNLNPMQVEIYNTLTSAWQIVLQNVEKALVDTGQIKSGVKASAARAQFWGSNQRFFNQIITSMSMPSVIKDIKAEMAQGHSIVLQLVNTNQSAMDRQLAKMGEDEDYDDLDLTPTDTLVNFLEKSFPIQQYEEYTDENGKPKMRPVFDSEGNPVINQDALDAKEALIARVKQMKVPQGPLEILLEEFGDEVAEVTGRTRRVYYNKKLGKTVLEKRSRAMAEADANAFQDGKKHILAFTDAGGTGMSYHADKNAINQQRRVHYLLQAGWNAFHATQGFGRTHRTNQASAPIFRLVTTNLSGQKRFISTIAKRLDQLGALTKGQRQAGNGIFSEKDNLEGPTARDTLRQFYQLLYTGRAGVSQDVLIKMGLQDKLTDSNGNFNDDETVTTNVGQFLNRILNLNVQDQNDVFEAFFERLEVNTQRAIALGTIDVGLENYKAEKIEFIDETVINTTKEGAETKYVQLKAFKKYNIITAEEVKKREGFREFRKIKETGEVVAVFKATNKTMADGSIKSQYKMITPMRSASVRIWTEESFLEKTEEIEKSRWVSEWKAEIAKLPELKEETLHMLTGALLPIWNKLPDKQSRVLRIIDSNNDMYLGRLIDATDIDETLRKFDTARTKVVESTESIMNKILKENKVARFDGKVRLARRRVAGEYRIEIIGPNLWYGIRNIQNVINEKINYKDRYFIPTDLERGGKVLTEFQKVYEFLDYTESDETENAESPTSRMNNYEAYSSKTPLNKYSTEKKGPIKPVHQIMRDIRRYFHVGINATRYRAKKAYAHFKLFPDVIEEKIANTIEPVMHELGHHFDYKYKFHDLEDFMKEMIALMPQEFKDAYDPSDLSKEAVAEFVRLYLTMPIEAENFGGGFYDVFEKALDKTGDLEKLQLVRADIVAWLNASTEEQIRSTMVTHFDGHLIRDFKQDFVNQLRILLKKKDMFLYDRLLPLADLVKYIEYTADIKLDAAHNAYLLAGRAAKASVLAKSIIEDGMIDVEGEVIAPSFNSVFKDLSMDNYDAFSSYLVAKRSLDYHARDKRTFSDDLPMEYVLKLVEMFEQDFPEFQDMADELYAWWEMFTREWIVKTGLLSEETFEYMRKIDPHYVPFFRLTNEMTVINNMVRSMAKNGYVDLRNPMRHSSRKGGSDPIFMPLESMVMEIERYVSTVTRREVMLSIHEIYQSLNMMTALEGEKVLKEGLGDIINRVNPQMQADKVYMKDKKIDLAIQLFEEFAQTMSNEDKAEYLKIRALVDKELISFDALVDFFTSKGFSAYEIINHIVDDVEMQFNAMDIDKEQNIVTIKDRGGNTVHYEVMDPLLLQALLNTGATQHDTLMEIIVAVRRLFQALITTFEPVFWGKNVAKDMFHGFVASDIPMWQFHARLLKSMADIITRGEGNAKYKRIGGGYASMASASRKPMDEIFAKMIPGWKRKHPVKTFIQTMELFSDALETAPRKSEAMYHLEKNGDTYATRLEALYKSQDVTVNFNRKGMIMDTALANLIPFFNPALQGYDKIKRMHNKQNIKRTIVRSLVGVTLVSLALYARNRRDPYYEKLSNYTKDNFYIIPTNVEGVYRKVPKPRELGMMYGSTFERALEAIIEKNPYAWEGYLEDLAAVFIPPLGSITQGYRDAKSGITWYGSDIVPYSYKNIQKDAQYDSKTSWVSKQLAKIIPDSSNFSSPMVLDYLISQYTGVIGKVAIPLTDSVKGNAFSYVNQAFTVDVAYSNVIVPRFYERLQLLESVVPTAKKTSDVKGYEGFGQLGNFRETADQMTDDRIIHDAIDAMNEEQFKKAVVDLKADYGTDFTGKSKEEVKRFLKLHSVGLAEEANKLYDIEVRKVRDQIRSQKK